VRGPKGSDAEFDYLVYGLRIGFEELAVVQPKARPAFLPEAKALADTYGDQPELRRFSALERFKGMRRSLGSEGEPDLTRAAALAAAIDENRTEIVAAARAEAEAEKARMPAAVPAGGPKAQPAGPVVAAPVAPSTRPIAPGPVTAAPAVSAQLPGRAEAAPVAAVAQPPGVLTTELPVSERIEAGDVLVADPLRPGIFRRGEIAKDPTVAGIVVGLDPENPEQAIVAVAGVVLCKVDATLGAVRVGDLLAVAPTLGFAMRAADREPGTILGKALEPLEGGTGTIKVLVMPR
jgi:hypothetical protein